jgi:hypothetical protein
VKDFLLQIDLVFSPEQLRIIDERDWYDFWVLQLPFHSSYRIRDLVPNPREQKQTRLLLSYGNHVYISDECTGSENHRNKDAGSAREQLEHFRWHCIRATKPVEVPVVESRQRGRKRRFA